MTDAGGRWKELGEAIVQAGTRLDELTEGLDDAERADGYRALTRALNNQLGRFENDRERPEFVFFNGWREKFFMDNPDFRYWVADIRDDRRYRISGTVGDSVFMSITTYSGVGMLATATTRIDSDTIAVDTDGRFELTLSPDDPGDGAWLALEPGVTMVWLRQFHEAVDTDALGECTIEAIDPPAPRPIDPKGIARSLQRVAGAISMVPEAFAGTWKAEADRPNEIRHWAEMAGGAGFTEPGIHYLRGAWKLAPDEALVITGVEAPSRYWNILLYSRFLNSLDYRSRPVSRTSGTATIVDSRYGFVLAGRDPGGSLDWLDTEDRAEGVFVMRWLQPDTEVGLPEVRMCKIDELES